MSKTEYDIGVVVGQHNALIKQAHDRLDVHEKRIGTVETWQEQKDSIDRQKIAIKAMLKLTLAGGIALVGLIFCTVLLIVSPSDMKAMAPQLIELIKSVTQLLR